MVQRFIVIGLICTLAGLAEDIAVFPKPAYFRQTFSTPNTRVELQPPVRLSDFQVDGKLELSLRSYLELVMANNTDVAITKLSVETFRNAITRAFSPFDPLALASFTNTRSRTPTNDALAGASTLSSLSQPYNFSYQQRLQNGTNYTVQFGGVKSASNSGFQNFNPFLTSNLGISFSQPLLRNRGGYANRLPIMIARSRLRQNDYNVRDTLLRILTIAENAYWDVVGARENLAVQESALKLADAALKRSQRELELGAMSPLDIFQPQQQYATAEISVSRFRYNLLQTEDALRKQIGADLDPAYRKMPIVLTESAAPPPDTGKIDTEAQVEKALLIRPDLKSAIQNLDIDDLGIKQAANALKPALSLIGGYTSQGRGGNFFQRSNVFNDAGASSTFIQTIPGGFGDALTQMFGFGFPVYSFGLQLQLPIRDRNAAANMADAVVSKKRDALQVRNVEQTVRLDVLTAVNNVEASKESVKLAAVAADFAQKRLDAEQKKYELGTSQIIFVLLAQTDLVNAQSEVVQESVRYRRNLLNLLRTTGELLDERGIAIQ